LHIADSPNELTIRRLTDAWINNSIRPNPEYQRGAIWRSRQQQLLIDSVFRGYPLPRFYFQQRKSTDVLGNEQTSLEVIDGQQRLIALSQYREDKWPLFSMDDDRVALPDSIRREVAPWAGKTFSSLPDTLQQSFLDVPLSVVLIDHVSGDEVRDLFIRLQAGTPLTAQQVRDAWPGNIGPFIERLAGKGTRQGQFQSLFQAVDRRGQGGRAEDEYEDPALDARQTCAQLLLLMMSKERGRGYPSLTSAALNDLYHENTEFDPKGRTAQAFEQILTDTQAVISRRPMSQGRKAVRKNRLFSLFLFLRLLRFSPVDVRRAIPGVADLFWTGAADDNEPAGRVASSGTLEKHFVWFVGDRMADLVAPELDSVRLFTPGQKEAVWNAADGRCGVCGEPINPEYVEYDHIKPWILGGRTTVENGRPVHPACHARGLAAVDGTSVPASE
jgi:hypothetical protein